MVRNFGIIMAAMLLTGCTVTFKSTHTPSAQGSSTIPYQYNQDVIKILVEALAKSRDKDTPVNVYNTTDVNSTPQVEEKQAEVILRKPTEDELLNELDKMFPEDVIKK